ncbi:DNA methyltransferase Dim-2 [Arthroderma uncinatum]|uniref:DNA methyltransferase Dim-2 n=1 Tax=Arthroderma uncinatum TaxID=74035 RepID=UPI00144A526A|nr:DNA methyltransferase Dim-2 [Arthroderma uncinatum]KAF3490506.1 DNA methyltransferase Dim-2 [Arthroderma uncinatum]
MFNSSSSKSRYLYPSRDVPSLTRRDSNIFSFETTKTLDVQVEASLWQILGPSLKLSLRGLPPLQLSRAQLRPIPPATPLTPTSYSHKQQTRLYTSSIEDRRHRASSLRNGVLPLSTLHGNGMASPSTGVPSIFSEDELDPTTEESSVNKELLDAEKSQSKLHAKKEQQLVGVVCPPLISPLSAYEGALPPYKISKERHALSTLLLQDPECTLQDFDGSDFVSFTLDDFTIYSREVGGERRPGMVPLNDVANKEGGAVFFFDGILRSEQNAQSNVDPLYLQQISFSLVSLGGYEDPDLHTVGTDIWIQSTHCKNQGKIWYRLGKPSSVYEPYHHFFVWLADFAKHFVDYLHADGHENVTLNQFKDNFYDWLVGCHKDDPTFTSWLREYGSRDFRHAINAHGKFLRGQSFTVDADAFSRHKLWDEIGLSQTPIITEQPKVITNTVVTPFVYECFKDMPWSNHLQRVELAPEIERQHKQMVKRQTASGRKRKTSETGDILVGDVVAVKKDSLSVWKGEEELWYALVQGFTKHGSLQLIWLYRPTDTVCTNMTYPYDNELFLSDHCNCHEQRIPVHAVVKKISIDFFAFPENQDSFFVRQTYRTKDETFTTLVDSDFMCHCRLPTKPTHQFKIGDTVLAEFSNTVEPAEIITLRFDEVTLRVFLRRGRDLREKNCRPNELVYSNDNMRTVPINCIQRHCHIRFFAEGKTIPCPYNRDGAGDAFYILFCKDGDNLVPMKPPPGFKQGFDQSTSLPKLKALNLFSGGGTLDRGLEEGTAIQSKWAVEWGLPQMLTYRANHPNGEDLKLFCGSVNDYLFQAITGKESEYIAQLGEVDFISGGSPCQGYSSANANRQSEESMRNSSMITSVASYIDLYRPQYAILENVTLMASKSHKQNPLSQLLCAFVGMGYQARVFSLDAWSFGAPQSRSRLFIVIAAPGLHIPDHPHLTHSHPEGTRGRALGNAPNGLTFGERRWGTPVFDFISAGEATKDLPKINTARIMSIPWPDHRPSRIESKARQTVLESIPKAPPAQGLVGAIARGWINCADHSARLQTPGSKAWTRVDPSKLFPTVTTVACPYCKFTGRWVHWQEDRVITVQEVRRAQGFPDSEVLIGTAAQQWKIVGNSVARQVALALGLSVREACIRNQNGNSATNIARSGEAINSSSSSTTPTSACTPGRRLNSLVVEVSVPSTIVDRSAKRRKVLRS